MRSQPHAKETGQMIRQTVVALAMGAIALAALTGCGGGSGTAAPNVGAATLEGYVYGPSVSTATVDAAAADTAANPAAFCQVSVERTRTRARIATTQTDATGHYYFGGLPANVDATVRATLGSGAQLMSRVRLHSRTQRADIDENTTMSAACQLQVGDADGTPADDEDLDQTVGQMCLQYQLQHRYQYRSGQQGPPDIGDPGDVADAAVDLLAAATDDAVTRARLTRRQQHCEDAVTMIQARLRQREGMSGLWDAETRRRAAEAMRLGRRITAGQLAEAWSRVLGTDVTQGDVARARDRLRERIHAFDGEQMEVPEGLGCPALGDPDMDHIRLRTQQQVRECLQILLLN